MFLWAAIVFASVFVAFLLTGYPVSPYFKHLLGNYYTEKVRFPISGLLRHFAAPAELSARCAQDTAYFTILSIHYFLGATAVAVVVVTGIRFVVAGAPDDAKEAAIILSWVLLFASVLTVCGTYGMMPGGSS